MPKHKPKIVLLAAKETAPSVLYGLYDVLLTTGVLFQELLSGKAGEAALEVKIVARTGEPFRCVWDVQVEPHASIDDVSDTDAVIVCDMYVPADESPFGRYDEEAGFVKRMFEQGAIIGSVCSGSLVVAQSGILDGYKTSSHWIYGNLYRDYFPNVELRLQDILTVSGPNHRVVTSGGVTAWQDLALYLISRLCSQEAAIEVAKVHMLATHDEGQLPYAVHVRPTHADAVIRKAQKWIARNYAKSNPVSGMVEQTGLHAKTFTRRFKAAMGCSPIEYVHALRTEEARRLLESKSKNTEDIAQHLGYDDPVSFQRMFKKRVGLTPAQYRRKFSDFQARSI